MVVDCDTSTKIENIRIATLRGEMNYFQHINFKVAWGHTGWHGNLKKKKQIKVKLMKLQLPISAFWWQLKAWKPEIPRDNARVRKKRESKNWTLVNTKI